MVSSTRTSSALAAHPATQLKTICTSMRSLAMLPAEYAHVDEAPLTDAQLMREEVESLCSHMLWLRAWWEAHGEGIRAADRRAAASIHDHFIDGAIFARSIARKASFDLDEQRMKDYSWGCSMQTLRMVVGGVQ